jgi:hypothetical protein
MVGGVNAAVIWLSFSSTTWEQKLILLATASALSMITLRVVRLR